MSEFNKYKIIGETRDDAAGEAFDKVAKLLGLGYPGGPVVAQMATKIKSASWRTKFQIPALPRPMMNQKNYDFSFSGLKTAVLYLVRKKYLQPDGKLKISQKELIALCTEFQQAVIDVLISKTIRAAKEYKTKTIALSGGVAANDQLREKMKLEAGKLNLNFLAPEKKYCTDNAAMIALAAHQALKKQKPKSWKEITTNANLRVGEKI